LQLSIQGTSAAAVGSASPTAQGLPTNPASLLHDWTLTIKQIAHKAAFGKEKRRSRRNDPDGIKKLK